MRRASMAIAAAGLTLVAACGSDGGPLGAVAGSPELAITTDRLSYTLRREGATLELTVGLTFTNTGSRTVWLPRCLGLVPGSLYKRVAGEWVLGLSQPWPACAEPPVPIPPRVSLPYSFRISAELPGMNTYPRFDVAEIEGIWRIEWVVLRSPDYTTGATRVSNAFHLAEPE